MSALRVAVIGAGSVGPGWGNGKATAVAFAQSGARVVCVDRDAEAARATRSLIEADGGDASDLALDVTDRDAGAGLRDCVLADMGGIDVLHFNVGISQPGGVLETDDAAWDRVFDTNLTAAMRLTRAVLPHMRDQQIGVLTYVSSLAAVYSGPYAYVSYEASKAALCRMCRSIARENARFGIRANTILPGMIDTPHVAQFIAPDQSPEDVATARAAAVPMGRQGTAWDVAHAAVFLASDKASYITGVDLRVDGGLGA